MDVKKVVDGDRIRMIVRFVYWLEMGGGMSSLIGLVHGGTELKSIKNLESTFCVIFLSRCVNHLEILGVTALRTMPPAARAREK
ncbi:MAG: hypothetical protein C7B44_01585 [Sulfobacillus thermosulfidooxidans]|nr:hypothetical protein CO251_15585 [Sulfobacillus sp. hq2]PSR37855.1 MAG: hypothetical protein C7B44_01585 [Sulfobacillus thermosulfidooxidans]